MITYIFKKFKFYLLFAIFVLFVRLSNANEANINNEIQIEEIIQGFDDIRIHNNEQASIHTQRVVIDAFDDFAGELNRMNLKMLNAKSPKIEAPSPGIFSKMRL